MRRRLVGFTFVVASVVLAFVIPAFAATAVTVRGQAVTAKKLPSAVVVRAGQSSTTTFTIRKSNGTPITGYAVATTRYFERGPNDNGYHAATKSEAYTVFRSWGGGGFCPSKFVYTSVRYNGKTRKVLAKVYYYMAGE
jgi:hypothetical protein